MKPKNDQGMTLLEVTIALVIFIIGIGFIAQGDTVITKYRTKQQLRQQMLFYAAGQVEHLVEFGTTLDKTTLQSPYTFDVNPDPNKTSVTAESGKPHLNRVQVTITSPSASAPSDVTLYTYRVAP